MMRAATARLVLGAAMLAAAGATYWLTPTHKLADLRPPLVLEQMVPVSFGGWTEEKDLGPHIVNPDMEESLRRIYTQTLSRTYVHRDGSRIMLTIAYGKDQSDTVQVHYPEICYPAQGFQVTSNRRDSLHLQDGNIPIKRLETNLSNQRYEPVTYWTTVGDVAVTGGLDKKVAEMRYGFHGQIPDGLLFRVSSIETDSAAAFARQDRFVGALAQALDPGAKRRLMGLGLPM